MSLANYSALKAAIADWLNRTDLTAAIPDFVTLAEATLNKVVRNSRMVASAAITLTASSPTAAVPADLLEPIFLRSASAPATVIEPVDIDKIVNLRRFRMSSLGTPRYYALLGRAVELAPVPLANISATLTYYQVIPALSDAAATNWLLTYDPDLYLYAALMHASPYLKDDRRADVFGNRLVQMIDGLLKANATATFEATP